MEPCIQEVAKAVKPPRVTRWLCGGCYWLGDDAELLHATSPFDPDDTIVACPRCKAVNAVENACDEPGCNQPATCGFPDPGGYRRTCFRHYREAEGKL